MGCDEFREAGLAAQRASLTLLTNRFTETGPLLPLRKNIRLYTEGVAEEAVTAFAIPVSSPAEADVALLRVDAP